MTEPSFLTKDSAAELFKAVLESPSTPHSIRWAKREKEFDLHFDEKNNGIVIELLKPLDGGKKQEFCHSLIYQLVTRAEHKGITLAADHFTIRENHAGGQMAAGAGVSISRVVHKLQIAPKHKAAEKPKETSATQSLGIWAEAEKSDMERVADKLETLLGMGYTVNVVITPKGKEAVQITPRGIAEQVLDRFGIKSIEGDIAKPVIRAFQAILTRAPEIEEIVIGDRRFADVDKIQQYNLKRDHGGRSMGM
jgi:hypothetical protein